ncbi:2-amino-3-carboxymuconate-6-semialdehyde decarboxylase [Lasiodiplodia theobromae]|uniref:2-amino-3-carboxymuconate-6-semialdehyde decarboxylase n=1 Tax=Lasiodiplodia theobromae TaxID=45133 RepID=UPI0015C39BD3|nr:2-amino-3-carboxymuconate-6-semialdehyde decarboxylase [Lasiodiplodia theobromae]KAF4536389.1 2-amino-3-carboxymuconate-6-semialdehyde decarboxylase [Lasiodiplodia theobromae]
MATCKLMRTSARQSWIILSESSLGRRSFSYSSKTASSSPRSQSHKPSIPAITLEEHFLTASSATKLGSGNRSPHDALSEVTGRDLRKGLIDSSPTPAEAAAINDELHAATQAHPDRFVGFAGAADGGDPVAAPRELRRAVTELGFVGALAVELDVPIYIHPAFPLEVVAKAKYQGNYDAFSASCIGSWAYWWHSDIAVHILRLYASGLFDAHPEVKLVIGHMGETLPMMIGRIGQWQRGFSGAKRSFEDVWKKNIYVTTSGFFDVPPLKLLLDTLPADHIMYSVDYPFGSNEQGAEFLERIEKENVFEKYGGEEAYRGFLRGNAEKLLKLREKGITSA